MLSSFCLLSAQLALASKACTAACSCTSAHHLAYHVCCCACSCTAHYASQLRRQLLASAGDCLRIPPPLATCNELRCRCCYRSLSFAMALTAALRARACSGVGTASRGSSCPSALRSSTTVSSSGLQQLPQLFLFHYCFSLYTTKPTCNY